MLFEVPINIWGSISVEADSPKEAYEYASENLEFFDIPDSEDFSLDSAELGTFEEFMNSIE